MLTITTHQTVVNEPLPPYPWDTFEPNQLLSFLVASAQVISFKLNITQTPQDIVKSSEKSALPCHFDLKVFMHLHLGVGSATTP